MRAVCSFCAVTGCRLSAMLTQAAPVKLRHDYRENLPSSMARLFTFLGEVTKPSAIGSSPHIRWLSPPRLNNPHPDSSTSHALGEYDFV